MKAAYIEAHGGPEAITYGDLPDPGIGPNDVLVRVRASALNRLDVYTRAGVRGTKREFPPPLVLGGDAAGDLEAVGDHVRDLKAGDRVVVNPKVTCGQCQRCLGGEDDLCGASRMIGTAMDGSYAQYLRAPAANVHVFSDQVSYEEAASVPTTFLPMWSMLVRKAELKPWESVLVLSASAGVGSAAIQVAKKVVGAHVIATTSSADKAAKARELGADDVIDYTTEDIVQRVKEITGGQGVDVVVDHLGTEFFEAAFNSLRPGGRYGNCGVTTGYKADLHLGAFFTRQLKMYGVFMGSKADMDQIVQMLDRGKIEPAIHQVFPLDRVVEAHRAMDELNFFGKLVLNP